MFLIVLEGMDLGSLVQRGGGRNFQEKDDRTNVLAQLSGRNEHRKNVPEKESEDKGPRKDVGSVM